MARAFALFFTGLLDGTSGSTKEHYSQLALTESLCCMGSDIKNLMFIFLFNFSNNFRK